MICPLNKKRRRHFFSFLIQMKLSDTSGIGDSLEYFGLAHSDYSSKGTADIRDKFLCGHLEVHRKIWSSWLPGSGLKYSAGPWSQHIGSPKSDNYKGSLRDGQWERTVACEEFWWLLVEHWPHQFGNGFLSPQVMCVRHSKKQDWHALVQEQKAIFKIPVSVFFWPLWLPT